MEIGNSLQQSIAERFLSGGNMGGEQTARDDLPFMNLPKDEAAVIVDLSSDNKDRRVELKEKATEMLAGQQKMGEFKDKKGLEETTDLQIGPDIRYALKTDNVNFLKRISWGPLTVAEYREVKHRISEIQRTRAINHNILEGKIIDLDDKRAERTRHPVSADNKGITRSPQTSLSIDV
ncbi:MAG: hypothetical protein JW932_11730 [Deltaproteobacteria bacterium]|nr:hypothetical protein [Deltaproteobacteria bacterium]